MAKKEFKPQETEVQKEFREIKEGKIEKPKAGGRKSLTETLGVDPDIIGKTPATGQSALPIIGEAISATGEKRKDTKKEDRVQAREDIIIPEDLPVEQLMELMRKKGMNPELEMQRVRAQQATAYTQDITAAINSKKLLYETLKNGFRDEFTDAQGAFKIELPEDLKQSLKPEVQSRLVEWLSTHTPQLVESPELQIEQNRTIAQLAASAVAGIAETAFRGSTGVTGGPAVGATAFQSTAAFIQADVQANQKLSREVANINQKITEKYNENLIKALTELDESTNEAQKIWVQEQSKMINAKMVQFNKTINTLSSLQNTIGMSAATKNKLQTETSIANARMRQDSEKIKFGMLKAKLESDQMEREGLYRVIGDKNYAQEMVGWAAVKYGVDPNDYTATTNNMLADPSYRVATKIPAMTNISMRIGQEYFSVLKDFSPESIPEASKTIRELLHKGIIIRPSQLRRFLERPKGVRIDLQQKPDGSLFLGGIKVTPQEMVALDQAQRDTRVNKDFNRYIGNMAHMFMFQNFGNDAKASRARAKAEDEKGFEEITDPFFD